MIICLCGSTRFSDRFVEAERELRALGFDVLSIDRSGELDRSLLMLRHLDKIAKSDAVLIIGGAVGLDTRLELKWAEIRDKPVVWRDAHADWSGTSTALARVATPADAPLKDTDIVTVCDRCLRACCWQGEFMCDYAQGAGTVEKTVAELRAGKYGEHEEYWKRKS